MTIINEQDIAAKPQNNENDIVISVNGVSKKFCRDLKLSLMYGVQDITSELFGLRKKNDNLRKKEFWALNNVSFQLRRGEALGLIGKNGSGKSTLLRIIAGLIKPDTGFVEVNGRVAPLIALGAGFNPILTGRENIYANMAILGLSKKEIDERFDEVIEFAEIGDAIDAPVQTYSSGMAARLGFASAIHTNPDILLIDEVLAVGDARFQAKCSRKLSEMQEKGTTFILVAHNSSVILAICDSAIYLSNGQVKIEGVADAVVKKYEDDLFLSGINSPKTGILLLPEKNVDESSGADITYICFKDKNQEILESPQTGKTSYLCVGCKVKSPFKYFALGFAVKDFSLNGRNILVMESHYDGEPLELNKGDNEVQIEMPYLGLRPGVYEMDVYLKKEKPHANLDIIESFRFKVREIDNNSVFIGKSLFYQPRLWRVVKNI
jgi:lipopolysaccharide transport system ATP-binding protein